MLARAGASRLCHREEMTHVVRAYLDAGSASMLLQLVLGGFAAVAVAAKLYWGRLMRFLRIRKPEPEPDTADAPQPAAERAVAESRGR
jgi:hypothetical protein